MEQIEFKAGDFVTIVGKDLEKDGIAEGSYLYLAGDTFVRETPDDAYLYRKAFVAARVQELHIMADEKPFLVTAKNFSAVEDWELAALQAMYESDFKDDDALPN